MTDEPRPDIEDTTMPPTDVTELHPRVRRLASGPATDAANLRADATRLDPYGIGLYTVPDPTVAVPVPSTPYRDRTGAPVHVSAPGTHTRGAPAAVEKLNAVLDERDRRERATVATTRGGIFRRRARKALTVRQHAERRALQKLRHERRIEHIETAKAVMALLCLVGLFLLVVAMGVVCFMILAGYMTWTLTRV